METHNDFVLFYTAEDEFSNWHMSAFTVNGTSFVCMEQFMMYAKAKLFKDEETAAKILVAEHPREQKKLGRQVKNYDDDVWAAKRENIVAAGCYQKFVQSEDLKRLLLGTLNATIVEASPVDKIWGVGMAMDDPEITIPEKWKGQNLLGKVLMTVRDRIRQEAGEKG